MLREQTKVNTTSTSLNYNRSVLQRLQEIENVHIKEIRCLRQGMDMLQETPRQSKGIHDGPNGGFNSGPLKD